MLIDHSPPPTLIDRLDLQLLRIAKRKRGVFERSPGFYDGFFDERDSEKYVADVRAAWRVGLVRQAFDRARPQGGGEVVDVGCGLGVSCAALPPDVGYVGFDLSAETLRKARRIRGNEIDFREGALPNLPMDSAACDFVICLEVIEHIEDDVHAIGELARVLRAGGHLLVSVPRTYYWPEYEGLMGHFRHYTAASLTRLLEGAGFEIVERLPQHPALWRAYHYLYVTLRGLEVLVRRAGLRSFSVYESALYQALARATLRAIDHLGSTDDAASTFVLCRKDAA